MDSPSPHLVDNEAGEEDEIGTTTPQSGSKRKSSKSPGEGGSELPCSSKKKSKPTRSSVWQHYTRKVDDADRCLCNYCGRDMCCKTSSGTTSLKNHIIRCKAHKIWSATTNQKQHTLNAEGPEGDLRLSRVSDDVIKEATNGMMVLGELPLSWVDGLAWRYFCDKVNFSKPHCRKTATKDIVKMFVKRKVELMKVIRASKQRVSLTTDIWVCQPTGASYMVITCHFIDSFWKLKKLIIAFRNIPDHKGSTISSVLLEVLAEWGIEKVFTITVDNATANTSALRRFKEAFISVGNNALVLDGEYMHVRCSAHIINLVVRDGLHEVESAVSAIRNAITYVRASTNRVKAFDQRVESGKMSRGSLPLDIKTRWNSTYVMLIRALKFKSAFVRMETEDRMYNDYFEVNVEGKKRIGPPTAEDWSSVERLVRFLVIFYNSTVAVSASTSVNSYKCYNEIVTIERNLVKLSNDSDELLRIKAMAMRQKFDKYWEGTKEVNRLLIIASMFDPRNKMKFPDMCLDMLYGKDSVVAKKLHDDVMDVLKKLFEEYNTDLTQVGIALSSQSGGTSSQSQSQSALESQDQIADLFDFENELGYEKMDSLYKDMASELGFQDASNELELYLKEKTENPKTMGGMEYDVLGWWRLNSQKYPVLSEIARDVLAMQVSSVASESAFSTSGCILTPSRSCLTHYMIEVLMCTEQWMKCEIHQKEKGLVTNEQLIAEVEAQDKLQRKYDCPSLFEE